MYIWVTYRGESDNSFGVRVQTFGIGYLYAYASMTTNTNRYRITKITCCNAVAMLAPENAYEDMSDNKCLLP